MFQTEDVSKQSKPKTLIQWLLNVGPTSATLALQWNLLVWRNKIQKRLASCNIIASLLVSMYISATLIQRRVCAEITISWKLNNGTVWKGCFYFIYLLQVDMYTLSKYIVKLKLCKTLQKCITLILTHQLNKSKSSQIDKEYNLTKNIPPSYFTLSYVYT